MAVVKESLDFDAARIKLLRIRLGETQAEFAKRCGVNQNTINSWETGAHKPQFVHGLNGLLEAERELARRLLRD